MFVCPKKVLNDSSLLKLFFEFLNIKHRKFNPLYPQANWIIKKFIKVLAKVIKT